MYEILSHPADEKFRARGESIEEVFSESVKAFAEIVGADPEAGEHRHEIEIESENLESLLFDFLDRLIFLQDTENVVVCHAKNLEIDDREDDYRLEAVLWTDPIVKNENYLDLKAPTYNEMDVRYEDGKGWAAEAVLDI